MELSAETIAYAPVLQGVIIKTSDYKGRVYADFYPANNDVRPGWVVMGKNEDYGGRMRMVCGRPQVKARIYKFWNGRVERGWSTRKEAQRVADAMNGK